MRASLHVQNDNPAGVLFDLRGMRTEARFDDT